MPPADPDAKIPCPTPQHLQSELDALAGPLALPEKEDTWEKMEKALIRFAGVTRGGGYKHLPLFVDGVGRKGVGGGIAACMLSDRGRLSGVATELLQTLAPRLSAQFAPLVHLYLEPLIKLLGRPNKVFLKRAEKCLSTIISHCHLAAIITELRRGLNDDAATCRRGCAAGIERAMREWEKEVFGEKGAVMLEESLRRMATDKDPEVRGTGKRVWAKFTEVWPERVDDFAAPLTPTIRRYLDISANGAAPRPKPAARPAPSAPPASRPVSAASASTTSSSSAPPPAAAPVSGTSSLHASSAAAPPRPHHMRPGALTLALSAKPARLPPPPEAIRQKEREVFFAAQPGPSRRQVSPRKAMDPLPGRQHQDPPYVEPEIIRPFKTATHRDRERERETDFDPTTMPFRHARSNSHAAVSTLSSAASYASLPAQLEPRLNPLSNPSRPILSASNSTASLPSEFLDASVPAATSRRFPPPMRVPLPSTDEDADQNQYQNHVFATPGGPLRGPVRPVQAVPGQKRPLGAPQRRIVTAPTPISSASEASVSGAGPTPGSTRPQALGRGIKERIERLEKAASPSKIEPSTIPLPASPTVKAVAQSLLSSPSVMRIRAGRADPHSPLMPVLARSTSSAKAEDRETETRTDKLLADESSEMADQTMIEGMVQEPLTVPPSPNQNQPLQHTVLTLGSATEGESEVAPPLDSPSIAITGIATADVADETAAVEPVDAAAPTRESNFGPPPAHDEAGVAIDLPIDDLQNGKDLVGPGAAELSRTDKSFVEPAQITDRSTTVPVMLDQAIPEEKTAPSRAPAPEQAAAKPSADRPSEPPITLGTSEPIIKTTQRSASAAAPSQAARIRSTKPPPDVKLPSVTARRAAARVVSAPERRPFKPTSQAKASGSGSNLTAPTASTAARAAAAAVSKPITKSVEASAPASKAVAPTVSKTAVASANPKPAVPIVEPARPPSKPASTSSFAAPTKASVSRVAPVAPAVKPIKVVTTAQVTLPPVKTEKIRRKAPLPSFKPVSSAQRALLSDKDKGKAAGTSSANQRQGALDRSRVLGAGAGARAKVKPESIALPLSPAEKAKLPPKDIPLPRSPIMSRSGPTAAPSAASEDGRSVLSVSSRGAEPGEAEEAVEVVESVESVEAVEAVEVVEAVATVEAVEAVGIVEAVARVKVKPEHLTLPESPVKMKSGELVADFASLPLSPATISSFRSRTSFTSTSARSPISLSAPRAISPVLTTSNAAHADLPTPPPSSPIIASPSTMPLIASLAAKRPQPKLNAIGLPTAPSPDKWKSISNRTGYSKASTQPAVSEVDANEMGTGMETDDEEAGVTFKTLAARGTHLGTSATARGKMTTTNSAPTPLSKALTHVRSEAGRDHIDEDGDDAQKESDDEMGVTFDPVRARARARVVEAKAVGNDQEEQLEDLIVFSKPSRRDPAAYAEGSENEKEYGSEVAASSLGSKKGLGLAGQAVGGGTPPKERVLRVKDANTPRRADEEVC